MAALVCDLESFVGVVIRFCSPLDELDESSDSDSSEEWDSRLMLPRTCVMRARSGPMDRLELGAVHNGEVAPGDEPFTAGAEDIAEAGAVTVLEATPIIAPVVATEGGASTVAMTAGGIRDTDSAG